MLYFLSWWDFDGLIKDGTMNQSDVFVFGTADGLFLFSTSKHF